VTQTAPALVPFLTAPQDGLHALAGVSLPVQVQCGKTRFNDAMLFTHRGLSGPAMLQISSYWQPGAEIRIDLLAGRPAEASLRDAKRRRPRIEPQTMLAELLPQRLAQHLARDLPNGPIANIPDRTLAAFAERLSCWRVCPTGTEGYAKAEVTRGGIHTAGLSSRTMQARDVPGLYAIGEAVDVTGWLGGHNFQWAWASGRAAGEAAAEWLSCREVGT
jgi:predicted Rossmann fold flavoprotein